MKTAKLQLLLENGQYFTIVVKIFPKITGSLTQPPIRMEEFRKFAKKLRLPDTLPTRLEKQEVELLIGNDYYSDIVTGERLQIVEGIYFLRSKLGSVLTGQLHDFDNDQGNTALFIFAKHAGVTELANLRFETSNPDQLPQNPKIEKVWSVETIGIKDYPYIDNAEFAMQNFPNIAINDIF